MQGEGSHFQRSGRDGSVAHEPSIVVERQVCKTGIHEETMDIGKPRFKRALQIFLSREMHKFCGVAVCLYGDQTVADKDHLFDVCYVRFVEQRLSNFDRNGILQLNGRKRPCRERNPT